MKTTKETLSSGKSAVKGQSRSGSGPQPIGKSHETLRDRAAANMTAFKKRDPNINRVVIFKYKKDHQDKNNETKNDLNDRRKSHRCFLQLGHVF